MADLEPLDRRIVLEMARVTEAAARSAARLIGRGQEKAADAAAVEAMRMILNDLPISGRVVIGEGERDEAPMLYIGEEGGRGGTEIDIALDPLEGTTITAKAGPNALAVLAVAKRGNLLNAPDVYMNKLAIGPGYAQGTVDLDAAPSDNVRAVAKVKGCRPDQVSVCVLDRPRHEDIIADLRDVGARVHLIPDGDVAGVIATSNPRNGTDLYMGLGGAPEGVLAAAALRCIGGQMQGRLVFRTDDERDRARKIGITDLDRKYTRDDMAGGHVVFSATGVTDGELVRGVHKDSTAFTTETLLLTSGSGKLQWIRARHPHHL